MNSTDNSSFGVVVIGRNEGERLRRCLSSVSNATGSIVYVDSGSTDGSVELALSMRAEVVALDMHIPFTAARARNAGFDRLRRLLPNARFVQFVDGDCELVEGWLCSAAAFLSLHAQIACVCGRLRERFPELSVYNRLCDIEWDRPVGETHACGGIAMMRAAALVDVGGFREDMVAGEEPELCVRLRGHGFKVWRLALPMAWHDAAMLRFGQWWTRSKRTGFSYAQRISVQNGGVERDLISQALRAWMWGAALPLAAILGWIGWGTPALLLLLGYPLQVLRLAARAEGAWQVRRERAFFVVLGKFPELLGLLQFWLGRRRAQAARAFDYKS